MSSELPPITQTLVDEVFKTLLNMEVDLDENPLEYGPRRLNKKTAETRNMLAECEHLFNRISGWTQKCRAAHRAAETELELEKKHLFANDPEVRAGRNVSTQDALASMKLRPQVEELSKIRTITEDLEAMLVVVKSKRIDLRDVQKRIGDQIRLCQEEIGLGGKWGSRKAGETPDLDATPNPDHMNLKALREMFAGVDSVSEEKIGQAFVEIERSKEPPESDASEAPVASQDLPVSRAAPTPSLPSSKVSEAISDLLGGGSTDGEADDFLSALEESPEASSSKSIDDLLKDFDFEV